MTKDFVLKYMIAYLMQIGRNLSGEKRTDLTESEKQMLIAGGAAVLMRDMYLDPNIRPKLMKAGIFQTEKHMKAKMKEWGIE